MSLSGITWIMVLLAEDFPAWLVFFLRAIPLAQADELDPAVGAVFRLVFVDDGDPEVVVALVAMALSGGDFLPRLDLDFQSFSKHVGD